jgi:hypothetical protein
MSRGRALRHERGEGGARRIADDCLKYLFNLKKVQSKEIHSWNLKIYSTDRIVVCAPRSKGSVLLVRCPIVGGKWMG